MTYPFITIGLAILFIGYIVYLAFIKKNIQTKLLTEVVPGFVFLAVWVAMYMVLK